MLLGFSLDRSHVQGHAKVSCFVEFNADAWPWAFDCEERVVDDADGLAACVRQVGRSFILASSAAAKGMTLHPLHQKVWAQVCHRLGSGVRS